METRKTFVIEGESFRDVGNASSDFRVQGALMHSSPARSSRLPTATSCHGEAALSRRQPQRHHQLPDVPHGRRQRAEHVETSIEFKVMVHNIHAGKHLPSGARRDDEPGRQPQVRRATAGVRGRRQLTTQELGISGLAEPRGPDAQGRRPHRRSPPPSRLSRTRCVRHRWTVTSVTAIRMGQGPLPPPADGDLIYAQLDKRRILWHLS